MKVRRRANAQIVQQHRHKATPEAMAMLGPRKAAPQSGQAAAAAILDNADLVEIDVRKNLADGKFRCSC